LCGAKALISFSLHPLPLPLLQPIFSLPRRHECVSNAPLKIWLGLWKKLQQFEVLKISCRTMRLLSAESNPWPEQFLILSVSGKYASPFWKKQNFSSEASARPPILSKRKCTPSPTGTMTRSPCDRKPPRRSSGLTSNTTCPQTNPLQSYLPSVRCSAAKGRKKVDSASLIKSMWKFSAMTNPKPTRK